MTGADHAGLLVDLDDTENLGVIGRGATGVVELLRTRDGELYAIKRLDGDWHDAAAIARFRREARIVGRLLHPNIVRSSGRLDDSGAWVVMEYLPGPNLREFLDDAPISTADALAVTRAVCAALEFAHAQGVVHRDISPANVLFDGDGHPKLADFGIATIVGADRNLSLVTFRTRPGALLGTPTYMSPEAASGATEATPQWDVYSTGVLAYRLLAGRPPFDGAAGALAVLEAHRSVPAPDPATFGTPLPPAVTAALLRALEKRPEVRTATIREFWGELSAAAVSSWPSWTPAETVQRPMFSQPLPSPELRTADSEWTLAAQASPPLPVLPTVTQGPVALTRSPRRWVGRVVIAGVVITASSIVWMLTAGHTPWH